MIVSLFYECVNQWSINFRFINYTDLYTDLYTDTYTNRH